MRQDPTQSSTDYMEARVESSEYDDILGVAVLVHSASLASLRPPLHALCREVCGHHKRRSLSSKCRLLAFIRPALPIHLGTQNSLSFAKTEHVRANSCMK